jgi:2-hydroxychromene-2-carboxylate isomerase
MPGKIEFWFEFASTYSYLSATRIEALATEAGVSLAWKPFLLGPIFQSQGWNTSPFNLYPAKGRYMIRDIERIASARALRFRFPASFPQNGLWAARLALAGIEAGWTPDFVRAVYRSEFVDGKDIGEPATLSAALSSIGVEADAALAKAATAEIKAGLRANTEEAQMKGIFGAPTCVTSDGELFWGDDRLEQAFAWEKQQCHGS